MKENEMSLGNVFPPSWGILLVLNTTSLVIGTASVAQETHNLSIFEDAYPCWSPDGSRIVFHSTRAGDEDQVFIMNADGSGVKQLTFTEEANRTAVFSPDGTRIAFQSERDGNREIYVMSADGSAQTRLTFEDSEDSHPKWSRHGRQIIFDSVRANPELGFENIYIMNADGTEVERVTARQEVDSYSSLSPDGSKVLFRRILPTGGDTRSGRNSEVFVMERDGSNVINLSSHPAFDGYPSWSPDGRFVLFASNRDGESFDEFNLYLVRPDGSGLRRLTETIAGVSQVRQMVSTDGERIVFNRDFPDGRVEIHVMPFEPE
jgi:Tol biopolymer transport system component